MSNENEIKNENLDDEIVPIEPQLQMENAEKIGTDEQNQENLTENSDGDENLETEEDSEISFADLGLDEPTLAAVERKGFKVPSPIQVLAIPRLLNGDANIIARARTGTGKTAAFGLPIIQRLRGSTGTVKALVLEPTRELAIQTCTEMQSFTEGKSPRTCVLYGGASYSTQIKDLRRGVEIVVGTPGRIQDHLERGTLDISKIEYFILDEGDEMLDMGFIDDIEEIFRQANPDARILLFSATMPAPILKIAGEFMGDYEIVEEEGVVDEPLLIDQKFWVVRENDKIEALVRLIDFADDFYGIVFTQTKHDADNVTRALDEKGYEVAALHGDIAQAQREKIIDRFKIKKTRILVATDVAARGIDIKNLTYVVNYSLPFDGATYVHRIGRTGRAGKEGVAVTFVCPQETRKLGFLQRAVRKASKGEMKEEKIPSVDEVLAKKRLRIFDELKENLGLSGEEPNLVKSSEEFVKMADELSEKNDAKEVLASVLEVLYGKKLNKSRYGKIAQQASPSDQTRVYIQIGRRDGYNPRSVADYFSKMLNIPGRLVDRIDMSANFTLVSLPKEAAKRALDLAKQNQNVPHMHIDIKESGDDFSGGRGSRGRGRGGFGGGHRGGRGRGFGGRREERSERSERGGRERFGGRDKSSRNFHNQTERSVRAGSAGLYKQKKGGKAERF